MRGNQKNKNYRVKWSPNLAYAIGLLTTDGNLSKDGRHIILVSKDTEQLKNFRECLEITNKISSKYSSYTGKKSCYHVQFSNVKLYNWLLDIGLKPNKTKSLGPLKIPNKYFFDFLRGHFDGDGSFYAYWDLRWKSSFMFYTKFLSASKEHILWLRSKIKKLLNINGVLEKIPQRSKSILYQLKYAKKESKKLFPKMYYANNIPFLKRKYSKIKHAEVEETVDSHP